MPNLVGCITASSTLGGRPVAPFMVFLYKGRVSLVAANGIALREDWEWVKHAFVEKYGPPTISEPNHYEWIRGSEQLTMYYGVDGSVSLRSLSDAAEIRSRKDKNDKGDL